jgi:hypothetical protein
MTHLDGAEPSAGMPDMRCAQSLHERLRRLVG